MSGIVRQVPSAGSVCRENVRLIAALFIVVLLCPPQTVRADIAGATLTKLTLSGTGVVGKMIVGADGNVWFLDQKNNAVGKMIISGSSAALTEFPVTPPAGQRINFLRAMTNGPDAMWILFQTCTTSSCIQSQVNLGRVTQDGTITLKTVTGWTDVPTGMIAAPDGNFWTSDPNGRLVRVTQQGVATTFKPPSGRDAGGPVVGPDQAIWFTEPGYIGRLTSAGAFTEYPAGASYPSGLTVGSDNNLWFIAGANKLGRMKTDGTTTLFTLPDAQASPGGLATGQDGNLWFTEHFDPKVGRLVVSSAKDDGSAQIDVQSFGSTFGKGGEIVVLPPQPAANAIAAGSSPEPRRMIANYMDSSSGGDVVAMDFLPPIPQLGVHLHHWGIGTTLDPETVEYSIQVTVENHSQFSGQVIISDVLPAGLSDPRTLAGKPITDVPGCSYDQFSNKLQCVSVKEFRPYDGMSFFFQFKAKIGAPDGTTISNQASAEIPSSVATLSNVDSFIFGRPVLTITKSRVRVLGVDGWRVTVTNTSPKVPTDGTNINVSDQAPSGVTWKEFGELSDDRVHCAVISNSVSCVISKTLAPGESVTLPDFIPKDPLNGATVDNVATLQGGGAPDATSRVATTSPAQVVPVKIESVQPTAGNH